MGGRIVEAAARHSVVAAAYFGFLMYRLHSRGGVEPRTLWLVVFVLLLALMLATAWQASSRTARWSWSMTVLGYTLSLSAISVAVVISWWLARRA
jgi:hypothetical protein